MADEISNAEVRELLEANKKMMQELAELKTQLAGPQTRILKRTTERTVEIRMVNDKVIVGFHNRGSESLPTFVYEKSDPANPTQRLNYIDLVIEGAKNGEYITVPDRDFRRQTERVKCKVIRTEEKEWVINQGTVKKKAVEEYSMIEQDYDVPVDIIGKTRWLVVVLPIEKGGREITVHQSMVNIG